MSDIKPLRIFLTGVGGQGTLTATNLLTETVLAAGLPVTSGEIHGMAQRGGVVESTVLVNCKSPKLGHGEADILVGFEPMETVRALPYMKPKGVIFTSTEFMPPLSVSMGKEECPPYEWIEKEVKSCTARAYFMPSQSIGIEAGAVQSGNIAMLAALCASGELPFGVDVLEATMKAKLPAKILDTNLKALELGVKSLDA